MSAPVEEASQRELSDTEVVVLDPIDDQALRTLRQLYRVRMALHPSGDELAAALSGAEVAILRSGCSLDAAAIRAASQLKIIARAGIGMDNIDVAAAEQRGITCFNVPGRSAVAVAELTLGLMLALARKIALADRQIRQGVWNKAALAGMQLRGRTLGIVGLGAIGSELAAMAQGIGMAVLCSVRGPSEQRRARLADGGIELVETEQLLRRADVVVLSLPLHAGTRLLIGPRELAMMRPEALLVNVSRGGVLDEQALYRGLRDGRIAGAALDVLSTERSPGPLAVLDNVVLTPHIGAMTVDAQRQVGRELVARIGEAIGDYRVGDLGQFDAELPDPAR